MSVTVVSACYGGYDELAPPPEQDMPCDWVMVTDGAVAPAPWRTVIEPRPWAHPCLAAKVPKARPFGYCDTGIAIWVDANMRIQGSGFVSWCVAGLGGADLAMTPHHTVSTITGEAALARPLAKYDGQPMEAQVAAYMERGFPDGDVPVWWAGLIVRRDTCRDFGDAWLAEMVRWGFEDQISLPYVLWDRGLRPASLTLDHSRYGFSQHRTAR